MKKIIYITLTVAVILGMIPVSAVAEYSTGLIWNTWDDIIEYATDPDSGLDIHEMSILRKGDIDGDGQITAYDARLCLRVSAQLEELSYQQMDAADVTADNEITSADARKILRISAELETADTQTVEMTTEWGVIFGALKTSGSGMYSWCCTVDDELAVTQALRDVSSDKSVVGAPVEQFFLFFAEKEGTYTAHFELKASWKNEPIDEFDIIITVK